MVQINLSYVVVGVILIAFLAALKKKKGGTTDNYLVGDKGDKCIISNGVIVCENKGVFPSWFGGYNYPYFGYGHGYPSYGYGGYGHGFGGHRGRRHRRWGRRHH